MIKVKHIGNFEKTSKFFKHASNLEIQRYLEACGEKGVQMLSDATPVDSGKTADSWSYEISRKNGSYSITWSNSNVNEGVNIAIILQYGHGTRTGGYVKGRDYINPALRPVFDDFANDIWKEVTRR